MFNSAASRSEVRTQKKVEEALRSKMKNRALQLCDPVIRKYAECATGRTLSIVWACKDSAKDMNDCLHQHTTEQVLDEFKQEYLASIGRRSDGTQAS
eukprot:jgi/Chlat1/4335/Chrsp29S04489